MTSFQRTLFQGVLIVSIVVITYVGYTVEYRSLAFPTKIRYDIAPPKSSEKYDFNKVKSKVALLCGLWKVVGHNTDSPSPEVYLRCMYKAGSMTFSKFSLWPYSGIGYNEIG